MRAINGYLDNGRFTPLDIISLPRRVKAMLVYNDDDVGVDEGKEARLAWLARLHEAKRQAADEEMPDFPRANFTRQLVNLSDED